MALSGIHVACGYAGSADNPAQSYALMGEVVWSETLTSGEQTDMAAPARGSTGRADRPVFQVYASQDGYVSVGVDPDATVSPRRFIPAFLLVEFIAKGDQKLAWVAA